MAQPAKSEIVETPTTQARIIETATELFLKLGYAGTSMSALAKASGIQKASLYHHFESKEAVLFACLQNGYSDTVDCMREAAERADISHTDRLGPIFDAVYGAIVESNAGKMAPVVAETTNRFPEIARRFHEEFMAEMQDIFASFAQSGIDSGEFDNMNLCTLEHALFGVPVNVTLCRSMFAGMDIAETKYNVEAVKKHHLAAMKKLLGV